MFLMPTRTVTQNYKMTLKNKLFKGSFLFWQGGAGYFNLTGSKILASVGQISVAFPTAYSFHYFSCFIILLNSLSNFQIRAQSILLT